jgi:cation diffusion facilitator CzcD-associated flavoprotein CzcO
MPETAARDYDVVVVGAGFSGLCMLRRLLADGLTVRVFDSAPDVGGAWYWNRYPGARCDVESHDYSFSFDDGLQQEWRWTERYAAQPEILAYVRHVADRFGLRPHIAFDTTVSAAHYDAERARWTVRTADGDEVTARFCVMATGCLSVPKELEIPGVADFRGPVYHTARWPEQEPDFSDSHVGVIGTGSSGVQAIPVIARQAKHLTVFQRTPAFVAPAMNRQITEETDVQIKAGYAERRRQNRLSRSGMFREIGAQSAATADEDLLARVYDQRWNTGGFAILGAFADLLVNRQANDTAAHFIRAKIRETVRDPDVAARLMPWDYPVGAKRLCVGTGYYETYNHDNVTLVDLRHTPLESVTATGVRTSREHHDLDCLILATGFDAITGALSRIDIRGRDGAALAEKWRDGPRTYLGLGAAGFPNLFILVGPGSPSVLTNMIPSIEQQVDWISACLRHLRARGCHTIEPTPDAEDQWTGHVQQVAAATLFPVAASWYSGANVPGKPRVFMPYAGGLDTYTQTCDDVAKHNYRGFTVH